MLSLKRSAIIVMCLFALAQAVHMAPMEGELSSSTSTPSPTSASAPADGSSPSSGDAAKDSKDATDSMAVSSAQDVHELHLNHSSFTCYGREIGYYADVDTECKTYHFCIQGDYNGEVVYQRISYLCLADTLFDQQELDCVNKLSAPCSESANHYEESNQKLRQAMTSKTSLDRKSTTDNSTSATTSPSDGR